MTFSIRLQQSKLQPLLILVLFSLVQVCGTIEKELGKAGETTRYLQLQSGAKIQVTGDNEAESGAPTGPAELSDTPEQISKAEQLIKEVLAEVLLAMTTTFALHFFFFAYIMLILQSSPG